MGDGTNANSFATVFKLGRNEIVVNEDSNDIDFRVESDTNTHMLFVDSTNNRVNIGINDVTSSAQVAMQGSLAVGRTSTTTGDFISGGGGNSTSYNGVAIMSNAKSNTSQNNAALNSWIVDVGGRAGDGVTFPVTTQNTFSVRYWPAGTAAYNAKNFLTIGSGSTVFNDDSNDHDFRVESDNNSDMLKVDASVDRVYIKSSGGVNQATLGVGGTIAFSGYTAGSYNSASGFIDHSGTALRLHSGAAVGGSSSIAITTLISGSVSSAIAISDSIVINEDSVSSRDFRVESDSVSDMFVVDAGANCVNIGAIGSTTTNYSLFVRGNNKESGTNTYYVQKIGASNYSDSGSYTTLIGLGVEPNAAWSKGAIGWTRTSSYDRGHMVFLNNNTYDTSTASLSDEIMRITSSGVGISGSLSKSSGSFRIPHPVASKTETHDLVHSFVEAPQADNIYRGKVDLVAGQATVNIDTVAGMTEGTFAALNREIQCFTSNETGWTAVRGSVSGNILTIEAQDNTCTETVSWLVVGERQDQHMYDTEWTDENGKVIVEPLKPVE